MHSASFGPILGPITTLTSLANFKARSLLTPRVTAESPSRRADSPSTPAACSTAAKQSMPADSHVVNGSDTAPADRCGNYVGGGSATSRAEATQSAVQTGVLQAELAHFDDQDVSDAVLLMEADATATDCKTAASESSSSSTAAANGLPSGDPQTRAAAAQLRRPPKILGDPTRSLGLAALLDSSPGTSCAGGTMSAHGSSREAPDRAAPGGVAPPGEGHVMLSSGGSEGDAAGPQQLPAGEAVSAGNEMDGFHQCDGVQEGEALPPPRLHQVENFARESALASSLLSS